MSARDLLWTFGIVLATMMVAGRSRTLRNLTRQQSVEQFAADVEPIPI